jgi:hypothetical protein
MKKFLKWFGVVLLVLVALLVVGRNFVARKSVEIGTRRVTGFPLEIGSVDVGLFDSQLNVRNLKLMNPPDFEEKMFVDWLHLYLDYRLGSMLIGSPHINNMLVNLKQVVIVKNSKGESNVQRLKGVASSSAAGGTGPQTAKSDNGKKMRCRVDQLQIHIGTVTIKDYTGGKPSERSFNLNVDASYKGITDPTDITRLVLMTMMSQARLPDIGIRMDDLKKGLGDVTDTAGKAIKGASENLEKADKGLLDTLKQAAPQK